jgi:hypothetical protein
MRPVTQVVSSVASGPWIVLDQYTPQFNCTYDVLSGGSTVQVDYTDDNPFEVAVPAVGGQVVASASANSSTSSSAQHAAVRLTCTVFVAAATLKVRQQGIAG